MDVKPTSRWWASRGSEHELSVDVLRRLTHDYWGLSGPLEERIAWYIERLLPNELKCAEGRGALEFHACHTLVLLVGHSIEPLLQAVSVFQPSRVVLVLSQRYDRRDMAEPQPGLEWGREVAALITKLPYPWLDQPLTIKCYEIADQPDEVFQVLCDHILSDRPKRQPVIVDITGGKKSMVAGAFLFAAYADIPISYVNFDRFDEARRRPLGFTCRIGWLTNPYDAFRLREWERVRRLYHNYHFRAAAEALADILSASQSQTGPLRPEHLQAGETLLEVLRFYEAWDDGDYHRAKELLPSLQHRLPSFSPPVAVTLLAERFPHAEDALHAEGAARKLLDLHNRLRSPPHSIFESNELLVTYARDELAKIERLVEANEDNRSALLRAAGLDELLLKARLVRLWQAGEWGWIGLWDHGERYLGECRALVDADLQHRLYTALVNHQGTDHMRNALQGLEVYDKRLGQAVPAFVRLDVWRESYRARPLPHAPHMADYEQGIGLTGETLTQLRNQAIHMYLYVTQSVAQAAVALAQANLCEFEEHWVPLGGEVPNITPQDVERLPWDRMCQLCSLDFLPLVSQYVEGT